MAGHIEESKTDFKPTHVRKPRYGYDAPRIQLGTSGKLHGSRNPPGNGPASRKDGRMATDAQSRPCHTSDWRRKLEDFQTRGSSVIKPADRGRSSAQVNSHSRSFPEQSKGRAKCSWSPQCRVSRPTSDHFRSKDGRIRPRPSGRSANRPTALHAKRMSRPGGPIRRMGRKTQRNGRTIYVSSEAYAIESRTRH